MRQVLFLLCVFFSLARLGVGQVKGVVVDNATGKPVAYATIWVENENIGATSSEKGEFSFPQANLQGKVLVVSCLGYEKARVPVSAATLRVPLQPSAVALREVTVKKGNKRRTLVINKLDDNTEYSFGSNGMPWTVAQFIPYKPSYAATPFLEEISLVVLSNIKKATFKLHVLQVGPDGQPGKELLSVPLMGVAPKGINRVKLNVSQYDLQMPPQGVFIAFEWLIIKQNRYEAVDPETGEKTGAALVSYEPSIRTYAPKSTQHNGWIYHQGKWVSTDQREGDAITSASPHFQLTLSD